MDKEQYIEKIVEIIKGISDTWLLKQIYRCVVNVTKEQKGGVCHEQEDYKKTEAA